MLKGSIAIPICLFVRGGLGNQLLQFAYIHHLINSSHRKQHTLYCIQPRINSIYSILRGNTLRMISPNVSVAAGFKILAPKVSHIPRVIPKLASLRIFTDSGAVTDHLTVMSTDTNLPFFLGYFQRAECFSPLTVSYWQKIYNELRLIYPNIQSRRNNTAMHFRFGDYLNKKNAKIYSSIPINERVDRCLNNQNNCGSAIVDVFTDSPEYFIDNLDSSFYPYVNLRSTNNPVEDLLTLASYRYIWGSNSTFSLCAGRISSLIHSAKTLVLPPRWYISDIMNNSEMNKWRSLDFILPMSES